MNKPVSYGSVCSGIEAASVAWHCLGWQPAWFAEIEKFPSAVLAYRWPDVSNLGDSDRANAANDSSVSTRAMTYCQAVLWIKPLLAVIEKGNNNFAGIRQIQREQENYNH
nr:hypothetical protein [Enterobacter mori]